LQSGDRRWLGCRLSVFRQGESTSHLLRYSLPPYHSTSRQHPSSRKGTKCKHILKANVRRPGAMITGRGSPIIISEVTPRSHTRYPVRSLTRHGKNRTTCSVIPTTYPYTQNYRITFTMLVNITRLVFLCRCLNRKLSWNGLSQNPAFCPPPRQNRIQSQKPPTKYPYSGRMWDPLTHSPTRKGVRWGIICATGGQYLEISEVK
jgi:hypothetical protein